MSRKYELVYVVSPDATDEQVAELHTQVESIIQRMHGQLEKTDNWGRRKLAYEIGRHKEGTYVLEVINGDGELMKEIDRRLKVTDLIIRHLVVRVDEEQKCLAKIKAIRDTKVRGKGTNAQEPAAAASEPAVAAAEPAESAPASA